MNPKGQIGIYFHWPFCLAKCPYCDFNVHVRDEIDHERWANAYMQSIDYYADRLGPRVVASVFFGGGTPSIMAPDTVRRVLDKIQSRFALSNDVEVTLEANPTSVENAKLMSFREAGINRLSLGVQSLDDDDLKFLGRKHSAAEARAAIQIASENFERFSFDLIYARPGQSLEQWEDELDEALKFARGHLSLYQLTIERSTPFYFDHAQGKFIMLDDDAGAEFYLRTQEILERAGLPLYEVSNHAAEGHQSKHNRIYWEYGDYIGIGPGAHGRLTIDGVKYSTRGHHAPESWLSLTEEKGDGTHPFEKLSNASRFTEALMMGLRLREGVLIAHLEEQGGAPWQSFLDQDHLARARDAGWIDYDDVRIWVSVEGMLRLNALLAYIIAAEPPAQAA